MRQWLAHLAVEFGRVEAVVGAGLRIDDVAIGESGADAVAVGLELLVVGSGVIGAVARSDEDGRGDQQDAPDTRCGGHADAVRPASELG